MPLFSFSSKLSHVNHLKTQESKHAVTTLDCMAVCSSSNSSFSSLQISQRQVKPMNWRLLSSSRHVFTNFLNTNLRFFSPIFLSWKKNKFLIGQRRHFYLSFEHLSKSKQIYIIFGRKKFVESFLENSWKYVVSLTLV